MEIMEIHPFTSVKINFYLRFQTKSDNFPIDYHIFLNN
jgi:hypothetical protein